MDRVPPILISVALTVALIACTPQSTTENLISNIDVDGAKDLIEKHGAVIILDGRTPEEYENGHIDGALNIGIADPDFEQKVSELDQA